MIISDGRAYIFVHIPKTGGTSLALALEARAMRDDILIGDTPKARKRKRRLAGAQAAGRLWKHSKLADIDGFIPEDQIRRAFTFTLIRNPWDRIVSYYHWLKAQTYDHAFVALAHQLEFDDFVHSPLLAHTLQAETYGAFMRRADGVEDCNLFIRLEQFEKDAQPLWDHLGFTLTLPHSNLSARPRDYRKAYTDKAAEHVFRICQADIIRFGYEFS